MSTHTTTHGSFHDRTGIASQSEIRSGLAIASGIRSQILRHFELYPTSHISPCELQAKYELANPIHSIRPRFSDLVDELELIQTSEQVMSPYGRLEHRYRRFEHPTVEAA